MIRQKDEQGNCIKKNEEAKSILESILGFKDGQPMLKGSPVGWYSRCTSALIYKPDQKAFQPSAGVRAACFTESTLAGLAAHRDVFGSRYGLAFLRDYIIKKGGNPCININEEIMYEKISSDEKHHKLYNFIPEKLVPFVNVINERFDATHEREWRVAGDFPFEPNEIMFVFCPSEEFHFFSQLQKNGSPVLFDLDWLGML